MKKKSNVLLLTAMLLLALSTNAQVIKIAHNGNSPELTQEIANYIKIKLNRPVSLVEHGKITEMTNALKTNKVDIAFMGSFGYILAKNALSSKIEPLVVFGKNNTPGSYTSSIITHRESGLGSITEIKTQASKSKFVLATPTSASGHIIPRLFLQTIGIESMENSFKSVTFSGGHEEVITKVNTRQAELGAIATGYLANAIKNGEVSSKDIAVLWTSGPIVEGPIVINNTVSDADQNKILMLFLQLPTENPALWKKIETTYPGAKQSGGYIKGKDEYYDATRKLISHIENLKVILQFYLKTNY